MTTGLVHTDRQILPRWRESTQSVGASDLLSLKLRSRSVEWSGGVDEKISEFKEDRSLGVAADLANAAIFECRDDALDLVSDVLQQESGAVPKLLSKYISLYRGNTGGRDGEVSRRGDSPRRQEISRIRRQISIEPRNPVLLMDLARLYATEGHREKAERFAYQALALAPNNRWVMRSTSRLLIAIDKPELGHRLLAKSEATRHDPWLIAAELAAAQHCGKSPKHWKQAQLFLDNKSFMPVHLSELASAVATYELSDGRIKKAKERFLISLKEPTENTLAQLKWAEGKIKNGFHLEELISRSKFAYEALFRSAYMEEDMEHALSLAKEWAADEPFAPEPVSNVTYIASLLDDYEAAIRNTDREFRLAGDRSLSILNNRVYAIISAGKNYDDIDASKEVDEWLALVSRGLREGKIEDVSDQIHACANLGLYLYRSGDLELGRRFYDQAFDLTKSPRASQTGGAVLCFHAREAILAGASWSDEVLGRAQKAISFGNDPGSAYYFRKIQQVSRNRDRASEIFSRKNLEISSIKPEKSTPRFRVEKTDKGLVLWVPNLLK